MRAGEGTIGAPGASRGKNVSRPELFYPALLLCLVTALSIAAPVLSPWERDAIDLDAIAGEPSARHVLGTDELGRDVLTRLLHGGRYSLLSALLSIAVATAAGTVLGAAAGYLGGGVDRAVTALVDLFMSIPVFLVMLTAVALLGGAFIVVPLVIGLTSWMETARVVRSRFMQVRGEGFVEASLAAGARGESIVFRHLLPQSVAPVSTAVASGLAGALLAESALSFLGFGVPQPVPTWGNMLHGARSLLRTAPLAAFAPGMMIFLVCLAFNLLADGARRTLASGARS